MSGKVVVLGGCGAVGSVAVRTLAKSESVAEVVVADREVAAATELATSLGPGVSAAQIDASDDMSIRSVIASADAVLNCVGPFYRTVGTVLRNVIAEGVDYVDVCDDVDVTLDILELDSVAREAGVRAVIGMGASPGITNLIAKYIADAFLDTTDSIDIFHTHGGEPVEGPGVVGHRFHCMSIEIPMFIDGQLIHVGYFEPEGIALRQSFDFPGIGDDIPIFPYPHPEQVTLPRTIACRRVTNKGSVLPIEYYELTAEACRLGLDSREAVAVAGRDVVPFDFTVAWLIRERERLLHETGFGSQRGCMSVVVAGSQGGEAHEYRVHMTSSSQALGEGTGTPAAAGVLLLLAGKVGGPGVLPPEAAVDPSDFLEVMRALMDLGGGDGSDATIIVEHLGPDGTVEQVDL
ncbi:MAG: Lysine 6-dehydrogenase [Acidimicrobiales bacterium]|nr:MAG: saccharopine dehydrogenase [Actinomycetota bacterium]MBV6508566.1 Lysine 6-dehydrogenase [Acidimicrobiales bacterium]RIK05124.1 MAG: saccharopine dehydrogenase [Acidobacteriota bacterium]